MEKLLENKFESHEQMIDAVTLKHFGENPKSITRMTIGICNEVYNVELSDREIIARLSQRDYFLKGSHCHIPLLKELGITVPEILAEDYSRETVPYSYQFLSKLPGIDIGFVIESLSDENLKSIAQEIANIFKQTKSIPTQDKFGVRWGDFTEFSDTWTERMRMWIDDTIKMGAPTGILDLELQSRLENIFNEYKEYFNQVKSTTYLSDISSKNVMIHDNEFSGVVDLDGLTQGDPLEAIGRIKASWPGTHYGDVYTNAIMDEQNLNATQRKMVLAYALLNRISWACENGIQFNQNTSAEIDREKEKKNREAIDILYKEYMNSQNT